MISSKQKIYLTVAAFMVLFICISIFAVAPILKAVKYSSGELASKELNLEELENQLVTLADYKEKQPLYQESLLKIQSAFVASEAPVLFMEFLEEQASLLGLDMRISPLSGGLKSKFSLGFNIKIAGSFTDCARFLERVETGKWFIEISKLTINRFSEENVKRSKSEFEDTQVGDVSFSLVIKALFQTL